MLPRRRLWPYILALASVMVAAALQFLLDPILGHDYPYLFFFFAVIFTVWQETTESSLFAAIVGGPVAFLCFVVPRGAMTDVSLSDVIGLAGYYAVALSMVWMGRSICKARQCAKEFADDALRAQEALQNSEERFHAIADNARAAFGIIQGTRLQYVNPAFSKMTGYSVDEILQMDFRQMVHPDFHQIMMDRLRMRLAGEPVIDHYEFRMLTKDGGLRWVDFSPARTMYRGKPAVIGTGFDVTERRQAEEALRESEATLKLFYNNSFLLIGIVEVLPDHSDIIHSFDNPAACRFFGLPQNGNTGRRATELGISIDALNLWIQHYRETERTGEPVSFEYHDNKEGEEFWLSVTASYLGKSPSGGIRAAYVAQDMTDKKRADEALLLGEQRLEMAQRAGRIGTFDWLITENKTIWSRQAEELYGLPPGGFSGKNIDWEKMVHPEDHDRVMAEAALALKERRDVNTEFRIIWPDGSVHWIADMAHPIFNEAGEPVRLVGVNMDITEHKRAEEALKEADRKKDDFLAMLAHELRNPLAAISAAEALLSRPGIDAGKAQYAKNALKERVKQLARLVDDLLDVTRITKGKIELHKENLDLEAVIDRAVESTKDFFNDRSQQLAVRVIDRLPVFGDRVRLEQVVTNLLTNASRYSEEGQGVNLTAFREGPEAVIRVQDQGIGIAASLLPRIFDPFIQAENSIARTRGGLGLGLTIVRNLCEMHGGKVAARSKGEGKGSEFEVRLPIGGVYNREARREGALSQHGHLRILLVEDNADTALMSATTLELEGHSVEIAGDGPAGVEKAIGMKPDVILLDIGLPGFSGYEVAERIRKAGLTQTLIIAVTGYGQEQDIARAYDSGINYHLLKPVDDRKLTELLARQVQVLGEKVFDA